MPIETVHNPLESFDVQVVTTALVVEEVIAAQKRLYLNPDHDPARPVLWDTRGVDVKSGFSEILTMVEASTDLWNKMAGGKSAILVAKRAHAMPARLYKQLAEAMPRELQVFVSYDDAVNWLGDQKAHSPSPNAS